MTCPVGKIAVKSTCPDHKPTCLETRQEMWNTKRDTHVTTSIYDVAIANIRATICNL